MFLQIKQSRQWRDFQITIYGCSFLIGQNAPGSLIEIKLVEQNHEKDRDAKILPRILLPDLNFNLQEMHSQY